MARESMVVAFVGSVVPQSEESKYPEMSFAGALFQRNLIGSLGLAGLDVDQAYSVRPVLQRSTGKRWWFSTEHTKLEDAVPVTQLPFVNVAALKQVSLALALFPRLVWWCWRHRRRPRAVVLYNLFPTPGIVSVLVGRLTATRVFAVVADVHVPGAGLRPNTSLHRLDLLLQRMTMPMLDGIIALSPHTIADFANDTPSIVVEGAVAVEQQTQAATGSETLPRFDGDGKMILMYAGNLSEFKGTPLLLEAFACLKGNDYRLWITGDGGCRPLVERAADSDPRIRYWGQVEYHELRVLYEHATILVNPHSTKSGSARYMFPSKLLEYLSTARPVITTCGPGVETEYGDYAFLLEDESPAALAALVEDVLRLPASQLEERGRNARAFVLESKSWRCQGERIAEFVVRHTLRV